MNISGNTVLVTGGGAGIGLAIATVFARRGNDVIICGRDERRLHAAKQAVPSLHTLACDVSVRSERHRLFEWATTEFPKVNMVVNNAGIQRETSFLTGAPELFDGESEIETNLTASIELSALFVPHFLTLDGRAAIINVTSGLAFIPLKSVPVYCATKAGLHSFSMSLRSQLAPTNISVFELIPPIVKTELHRSDQSRKQAAKQGIAPARVAKKLVKAIRNDRFQIPVGQGGDLIWASRLAPHFFHRMLNKLVDS
ncbi:SDR family oxidoreductase [Sphingomonas sp.]|uniref:SDR family oxidoreductase n=2 Tax=unclassified Sphingomonas TaxID=196159 RepID=UPI000BC7E821|nr:MAG: short-chain dehydrogenase [Sphingomonas sp. 12-62-6]